MNAPTSDRWPFPPTDQHPAQAAPQQRQPQQRAPQQPPQQYRVPGQPVQQRPPQYAGQVRPAPTVKPVAERPIAGRRLLGVLALLVLTGLSLPVHVAAVFFVYLLIESPGDSSSSMVLVIAAFSGSFIALLVTGVLSQIAGGFRASWRARVSLAAISAVLSLAAAYVAAITFF